MSFKCELCGEKKFNRVSPVRIITEIREVIYEPMMISPETKKWIPKLGEEKKVGSEIVAEKVVCPKCAMRLRATGKGPAIVGVKIVPYLHFKKTGPRFIKPSELERDDK